MRRRWWISVLLVVRGLTRCGGFAPPARTSVVNGARPASCRGHVVVCAKAPPREKVGKEMKRKLLQEASTPWRGVRLFFYGAFAFSAGVGLVTALAQLAASASEQPGALPASKSALNVAVDLGVVAACVVGYRIDSRAAADVVSEPAGRALSEDEATERSERLAELEVRVGAAENSRTATLETLRTKAGQSIVVLGGPAKAVDDALTDALIQQKLLAAADCLVVPVRTDAEAPPAAKIDRAGFVAPPTDDSFSDWLAYVSEEINTAKDQGAADAPTTGVVIAVRNDGSVARRGVGKPPWKDVIADLAA